MTENEQLPSELQARLDRYAKWLEGAKTRLKGEHRERFLLGCIDVIDIVREHLSSEAARLRASH